MNVTGLLPFTYEDYVSPLLPGLEIPLARVF